MRVSIQRQSRVLRFGTLIAALAAAWLSCPQSRASSCQSASSCPIILDCSIPGGAQAGSAYKAICTAKNGSGPYSYSVTAGGLPAGLGISGGVVSGTPTSAGTYSFTIQVTDATSQTAGENGTIAVSSGAPATIFAAAGTPQTAAVNTLFPVSLQALVRDAYNNPVPNAAVTFSASESAAGAVLQSSTVTTDGAGMATEPATANSALGPYIVMASVAGVGNPATFQLTNVASSSTLSLTSSESVARFGSHVSLSATLNNQAAAGTVTFYDGPTVLGSAPVNGGIASIGTVFLATGNRSLTAYYAGDTNDMPARSAPLTQTISASSIESLTPFADTVPIISTPYLANSIQLGDFDNNGQPDFVIGGSDGSVYIFLDNSFVNPASIVPAQGSPIESVFVGDFNGDGNQDLAVLDSTDTISILLGDGQGGFTLQFSFVAGGANQITGADFNNDGILDLIVASPSGTQLFLGNGDGSFNPTPAATAAGTIYVSIGDFNGDGSPDIAIVDETHPNTVDIILGDGMGGFHPTYFSASVGSEPAYMVVADFDGDGTQDLAVANSGDGTVSILLGNGDGTLQPALTTQSYGNGLAAIAVSDFSGDGIPDLAVFFSQGVDLVLGQGDGTFSPIIYAYLGIAPGPTRPGLLFADFNVDGRPDLLSVATLNASGLTGPTILLGLGGLSIDLVSGSTQAEVGSSFGTLQFQATQVDASLGGQSMAFSTPGSGATAFLSNLTATTDSAGNASSVATANDSPGAYLITAIFNGTPFSFELTNLVGPASSVIAVSGTPQTTAVETGFANPLVISVVDQYGNPVPNTTVFLSAPPSGPSLAVTSATAVTDATGTVSLAVAANELAGNYTVTIFVGGSDSTASFVLTNAAVSANLTLSLSATSLAFGSTLNVAATLNSNTAAGGVAFYDGNTLIESEAVTQGASAFSIDLLSPGTHAIHALYSGDASHATASTATQTITVTPVKATSILYGGALTAGQGPQSIAAADFNGDGLADLAVANANDNTLSIFLGNGDGTFQPAVSYPVSASGSSTQVVAADVNGDGKPDLIVVNGILSIYLGNGDGTFQNPAERQDLNGPVVVAVGDVNGDGIPDLVLGISSQGGTPASGLTALAGVGDGTFGYESEPYPLAGVDALTLADLNGDGLLDVVGLDYGGGYVYVLLNGGEGSIGSVMSYPIQPSPYSLTIGDFNNDGKLDVAVANSASGVSILLGNGDGTLAAATNIGSASVGNALAIATLDFDGDGNTDLAVVNPNGVVVLLGSGTGTFSPLSFPAPQLSQGNNTPAMSMAIADFNGDGRADIAFPYSATTIGTSLVLIPGFVQIGLGVGPATAIAASNATQTAQVASAFSLPLQIAAFDSSNNPVPGVSVLFEAPLSGASAALSSMNVTTDNTGSAGITASANVIAGTYAVSAAVSGLAPADFTLTNTPGPPTALVASGSISQSAVVRTSFPNSLQVLVTDLYGNPVPGVSVLFTVPATGASAVLSSLSSVTAGTGIASISATANGTTGSYRVTASVAGVAGSALFNLTNTPPTVHIATTSLPAGVAGVSYTSSLIAQGGVAPYTWSVVAGSLPPGITLNATTGLLSGTPTISTMASFTVALTDSSSQTTTQAVSLLINPAVIIKLPSGVQQPSVTISNNEVETAQPAISPISGSVSLSFAPNAAGLPAAYTNPGICFSSSDCATNPSTSAGFTITAGSTSSGLPGFQTGTVAGDIILTLSVPNQPPVTSTVTVPQIAPVIESNTVQILDVTSNGFVVEVVANSTPRDLQSISFTFTAASGATLNGNTTFSINLTSASAAWYSSAEGQSYGSAFSLQIPFSVTGDSTAISSVSVTLTNSLGTSTAATATM
ncbi:MAG TPA: FG-GAP-like repeat-containing protein [Bryobacteraceae bacterium]|nr:FG-GAP-like repeat-containing protein [Bryobacteraceae bacterium]